MKNDLAESIKRVAKALNEHKVEYMFVGGIAIGFYGTARHSLNLPKDIEYDIDIWYRATNENFIRLINGISQISPELKVELDKIVFDPERTFIKFSLDEFHFDFLPELVAFYHKDFKRCFTSSELGEIDGIKFNVISKKDLLFDKEKLARDKDLADLENLKKNSYKGFAR